MSVNEKLMQKKTIKFVFLSIIALSIITGIAYFSIPSNLKMHSHEKDEHKVGDVGTCQLFFTMDAIVADGQRTLRSATSTDGFTFTFEDEIWLESHHTADPAVRLGSDGIWRIVTGSMGGSPDHGIRFGYVSDEPYFPEPDLIITDENTHYQFPDLIEMDDGYRIYFGGGGIYSAFSEDGFEFEKEDLWLRSFDGVDMVADPTVARRDDGSYVMYYKVAGELTGDGTRSVKNHALARAFSEDGINWTHEEVILVEHASVPAAYTDANGTVWVYYLYFGDWPEEKESIWATYELDDGSLAEPQPIRFIGGIPEGYWTNNPSPMLLSD